MRSVLRLPLLCFALALVSLPFGAAAGAQQVTSGSARVHGTARSATDEAPISYALVQLLPSGGGEPVAEVLTDGSGRFALGGLPAGEYRLRLRRVGFEEVVSPALRLRAGEPLEHDLRSGMVPLEIAGFTVRPEGTCYRAEQLDRNPELAALWTEAKKGVEIRRAFERQYRYTYDLHHTGLTDKRIGRDDRFARDSTIVSEPDSVRARQARLLARRQAEGYGSQKAKSLTLSIPDERELLEDQFLVDHCLDPEVLAMDGALGVRFRPVSVRGGNIELRGTIWIEQDTYLVRGIQHEFLRGGDLLGKSSIVYRDIRVPGGTLRLPDRTHIEIRPRGAIGLIIPHFENAWQRSNHRGFERVVADAAPR